MIKGVVGWSVKLGVEKKFDQEKKFLEENKKILKKKMKYQVKKCVSTEGCDENFFLCRGKDSLKSNV